MCLQYLYCFLHILCSHNDTILKIFFLLKVITGYLKYQKFQNKGIKTKTNVYNDLFPGWGTKK